MVSLQLLANSFRREVHIMTESDKEKRYKTRSIDKEYPKDGASGNSFDVLTEALETLKNDIADQETSHVILIDTAERMVELAKGENIEPFRRMLDNRYPGWSFGTISRK